MAIVVVNQSTWTQETVGAPTVTSAPTFTSTAGNLLIALGVAYDPGGTEAATPMTDTGNTNTFTTSYSGSPGNIFADIAYAKNIIGQAGEAVTYHLNDARFPAVYLIEVSGCDTSSPNDVAPNWQTNPATSILNSTLITPTAGAHLIVCLGTCDNGGTESLVNIGTASPAWTTVTVDAQGALLAYAVVNASGSNTYGIRYTGTFSGNMVVGIAAFKIAAANVGLVALTAIASMGAFPAGIQYARPTSDVLPGAWTTDTGSTSSLYLTVGEVIPNDATYIRSELNPSNSRISVRLGPQPAAPVSGAITLSIRHKDSLSGGQMNYTYELMQGATILQTFGPYAVSSSAAAQIDLAVTASITDWVTPFDVRITATEYA